MTDNSHNNVLDMFDYTVTQLRNHNVSLSLDISDTTQDWYGNSQLMINLG